MVAERFAANYALVARNGDETPSAGAGPLQRPAWNDIRAKDIQMNTPNRTLALALAAALVMPLAAQARNDFNYIEANYINVDLDFSGTVEEDGFIFGAETDADSGFQIGASWQFWENFHVFGEYSNASQDLELSYMNGEYKPFDSELTAKGDFDVIRARIGIGYAMEVSPEFLAYGRVSYDYAEIGSIKVEGLDLGDVDDNGFGGELGALWNIGTQFQLQGHVRYSSIGDVIEDFDSDVLFGVAARWFFMDQFALQGGYEFGEINTWNVGVRFTF
jgi:hypothetical protein